MTISLNHWSIKSCDTLNCFLMLSQSYEILYLTLPPLLLRSVSRWSDIGVCDVQYGRRSLLPSLLQNHVRALAQCCCGGEIMIDRTWCDRILSQCDMQFIVLVLFDLLVLYLISLIHRLLLYLFKLFLPPFLSLFYRVLSLRLLSALSSVIFTYFGFNPSHPSPSLSVAYLFSHIITFL